MKRSLVRDQPQEGDWLAIRETRHIEVMLDIMEKQTATYFTRFAQQEQVDPSDWAASLSNLGTIKSAKTVEESKINKALAARWEGGFKKHFDKEEKRYQAMFNERRMEDFRDSAPKNFKDKLKTDCPIIHGCVQSKAEEMQEWQERFARAAPQELIDTFESVLDFTHNHIDNFNNDFSETPISPETFANLEEFSEDTSLVLPGVIGTGIKSTVAYFLFPSYFHRAVKRSLYGFYFLSNCQYFNLPSATSEFLMIQDLNKIRESRDSQQNYRMDQNYWYPYDLFMFYSYWLYGELAKLSAAQGIPLDDDYRFVYTFTFLDFICECNNGTLQVMGGGYGQE